MNGAIYLRLSRDEEKKGIEEVLSNHRRALIKLAKDRKIHFTDTDIYEEVRSGMDTDRPELNRLIANIRKYDCVLVMDQDRLTRDNVHAEQLKKVFIINETLILSPGGQIDLSEESAEILYSMNSLLANYEWRQIRKRLSRGRLDAARDGKWVASNKAPFGYQKDEDKKLVIDENEAKVIRLIFQRLIQGYTASQISKELDKLQWRTRSGKTITTSHIANYRNNHVYYGVVSMQIKRHGKVIDSCFVEGAHEPIISKEDFFRAQKVYNELIKDQENLFRKRGDIRTALQGIIYCDKCGRKRYIQWDKSTQAFYIKTCSYKVDNFNCRDRGTKYEPIEKQIIERVKSLKPKLEGRLKQIRTADTSDIERGLRAKKDSLKRTEKKLENRIDKLIDMKADGEISKKKFEERTQAAQTELDQVLKEIELVDMEIENLANTADQEEIIYENLKTLERVDELDVTEKNAFLKTIIKKIFFASNAKPDFDKSKELPEITLKIEWMI